MRRTGDRSLGKNLTDRSAAIRHSLILPGDRIKYRGIVGGFADKIVADYPFLHHPLGKRPQHCGNPVLGQRRIEPPLLVLGVQDHRHPEVGVVDAAHQRVRIGGDDRIGSDVFIQLLVVPAVVDTCKGDNRSVFYGDVAGNLPVVLMPPVEEATGRNQTTPLADRFTERGLDEDRLGTGIGRAVTDRHCILHAVRPKWDEAPSEKLDMRVRRDDRILLVCKGRNMVCRAEVPDQIPLAAEAKRELPGRNDQSGVVAHDSIVFPAGFKSYAFGHDFASGKDMSHKWDKLWKQVLWFENKTRFDIDYFDLLQPRREVSHGLRYRSGVFYSQKCGREIQYESALERRFVERLEADPHVAFYWEQPVKIPYWRGRRKVGYTPDYGIYLASGHVVLTEVKELTDMLDYRVQRKTEALMEFCARRGFGMLLTDGRHTPKDLLKGKVNRRFEKALLAALDSGPIRGEACREIMERCGATQGELYRAIIRLGLRFRPFLMRLQRGNDCRMFRGVFFEGSNYDNLTAETKPDWFKRE